MIDSNGLSSHCHVWLPEGIPFIFDIHKWHSYVIHVPLIFASSFPPSTVASRCRGSEHQPHGQHGPGRQQQPYLGWICHVPQLLERRGAMERSTQHDFHGKTHVISMSFLWWIHENELEHHHYVELPTIFQWFSLLCGITNCYSCYVELPTGKSTPFPLGHGFSSKLWVMTGLDRWSYLGSRFPQWT